MFFTEMLKIALFAVKANKLRSALTLLGIIVGVFSIIAVMTAVNVLQNSIESGLSALGTHTFKIQKQPVLASHAEWRRAMKRKDITYEQAKLLKELITQAQYVSIEAWKGMQTIQYGSTRTNPSVNVGGTEPEGLITNNWVIKEGRGFTNDDIKYTSLVTILGPDVEKKLFPLGGAVGSRVKIGNEYYKVIGVFEPQGSILGRSPDNFVAIPLNCFLNQYGKQRSLNILVKAKNADVYEDCLEEARMILRLIRNVPPSEEDDFTIFSNDSLISTFNEFTLYVKLGVGFMSFIALLAAGIGIMNIMLVSVTERTKEIGIRKAIGAKKSNILTQFVMEAVVLCQMGGILGIILGIFSGNLVAILFKMPVVFPVDWAIIGFIITTFVGLVFGVYPAWKAANLDPIETLRYE